MVTERDWSTAWMFAMFSVAYEQQWVRLVFAMLSIVIIVWAEFRPEQQSKGGES